MQYSFRTAQKLLSQKLKKKHEETEINQITKMIFEHYLQFSSANFLLKADELQSEEFTNNLNQIVERLENAEPIQYIIGTSWFRNMTLKVDSSVLIPRQETEELIEWMTAELENKEVKILDIGTGSGCIALSLKNELPKSKVTAWDVSAKALKVATSNALLNHLDIDFQLRDILNVNVSSFKELFDVVVSNPPYVTNQEKLLMQDNVLEYEPHLALFVEDDDPLQFYREIGKKSQIILRSKGWLFFEINEAFGNETIELLKKMDYTDIELKDDINGKHRMVKARKC